ncbi:MAG TPA: hypothetical protein VFX59_01790, partial [Polyangiales bacterium]|nr:hypothetical protein [Polyangiales bacterium]
CAEDPADGSNWDDAEASRVESALAADADGSRAINLYRLYSIPPDLYQSTFKTPHQDAPLATPDGVGAFQFFQGNLGVGAIYSHSYATSQGRAQQTAMVYGAILSAWGRWGWETLLGYPLSHEVDATDAEPDAPCRSQGGVRQQVFGYVGWSDAAGVSHAARVVLCWSPERDVWALPEGVAQGLRGEHALYQVRP